MAAGPYLTQCLADHIYAVVAGSELEERCKEREADGKLDAVILYYDECPGCISEGEMRDSQMDEMVNMFGCGFDYGNGCGDDCPCKKPHQDRVSPYEDQLTGLPVEALM